MIDDFFILVSTLAVVFIAVRAVILDSRIPWFAHLTRPPQERAPARRTGPGPTPRGHPGSPAAPPRPGSGHAS
jgi:hypothetical protein